MPTGAERGNSLDSGPTGVGGWLLLLIIGMLVVGPLTRLAVTYGATAVLESSNPEVKSLENWEQYKTAMWWTCGIAVLISLYGGNLLLSKRTTEAVEEANSCIWLGGPWALILETVGFSMFFFDIKLVVAVMDSATGIVAAFVAAIVWSSYLKHSKRVRKTYTISE